MTTRPTTSASDVTFLRIGSGVAIAVGVVLAVWTLINAFGRTPPPLPLTPGLLTGAALEIVLGAILMRGSRAARAFLLSLNGVASIAGLLAIPAFQRAGLSVVVAGLAVAAVSVIILFLAMAGDRQPPSPPATT